ncbi:hypothetical protein SHIRM173S_06231 [Streptomyces hirsutus]
MAGETKDPARVFPRVMFAGLGIAGLIYVLVSVCAVAVVPVGRLASSETPLATVVQTAAPDFPDRRTETRRSSPCSRWPTPR